MNYRIEQLDTFFIIGQEIEITNSKKENIRISTSFWKQFNVNLKKEYLSQSPNWLKYAFMERRDGKLYYYCAIPKKTIVPSQFVEKEILAQRYLVVEHIGKMNAIYQTYDKIYTQVLPDNEYQLSQKQFLHFEKYDYRFHWNRDDSIIEIWIPII